MVATRDNLFSSSQRHLRSQSVLDRQIKVLFWLNHPIIGFLFENILNGLDILVTAERIKGIAKCIARILDSSHR